VLLELLLNIFDLELLEKFDHILIGCSMPQCLLLVCLWLHELDIDVGCDDTWVLQLRLPRVVVLLPNDDLVSNGLISQVVSQDILELVPCNSVIPNISD